MNNVIWSNLSFFPGMNQRNGTDVDAGNVMNVFAKLGYKTKICNDQTRDQIMQLLTAGKYPAKWIEITAN